MRIRHSNSLGFDVVGVAGFIRKPFISRDLEIGIWFDSYRARVTVNSSCSESGERTLLSGEVRLLFYQQLFLSEIFTNE